MILSRNCQRYIFLRFMAHFHPFQNIVFVVFQVYGDNGWFLIEDGGYNVLLLNCLTKHEEEDKEGFFFHFLFLTFDSLTIKLQTKTNSRKSFSCISLTHVSVRMQNYIYILTYRRMKRSKFWIQQSIYWLANQYLPWDVARRQMHKLVKKKP